MPKTRPPRKLKFLCGQPKDCQSDCCQSRDDTTSQQFTVKTELKRGKLVFLKQPTNIICRVASCRLYGKAVKNFNSHIYEQHGLTFAQHKELPPATLRQQYVSTKTNSSWMRSRKPEICFVPGCKYQHNTYLSELVRHLQHEHSMSRDDYRQLLKTLSLKDFDGHCPAMIEEIEESAMEQADKLMGKVHHPLHMTLDPEDEDFPTVRLVHLVTIPDGVKMVSFREKEIGVEHQTNSQEGILTLIGRKRFMSREHRICFMRSIDNSDPWIFPKNFSWIKYMCSICSHVHTLDIVAIDQKNISVK